MLRELHVVVRPQNEIAAQPGDNRVQGVRLSLPRNEQTGERNSAGVLVEYGLGVVVRVIVRHDHLPGHTGRNGDLGQRGQRGVEQIGPVPSTNSDGNAHGASSWSTGGSNAPRVRRYRSFRGATYIVCIGWARLAALPFCAPWYLSFTCSGGLPLA